MGSGRAPSASEALSSSPSLPFGIDGSTKCARNEEEERGEDSQKKPSPGTSAGRSANEKKKRVGGARGASEPTTRRNAPEERAAKAC
mmetsp:Transcript_5052/g.12384  ORF Transcript_5052/g.12384 Transcript_5052/m.12384 type:complete len:87 (+) Transcript_5052:876-1136(+)